MNLLLPRMLPILELHEIINIGSDNMIFLIYYTISYHFVTRVPFMHARVDASM